MKDVVKKALFERLNENIDLLKKDLKEIKEMKKKLKKVKTIFDF